MRRINVKLRESCSIVAEALESRTFLSASNLDPSFGSGGAVVTAFGSTTTAYATNVVAQNDGKILVAAQDGSGSIAVIRYRPNGTLDSSFGSGGKEVFNFGAGHSTGNPVIALQSDGKILVGGDDGINATNNNEAFVIRLTTAGKLDSTFGTGGELRFQFGTFATVNAITALASGKILIAAVGAYGRTNSTFLVKRLNSNGATDTTFGTAGIGTIAAATQGYANFTGMVVESNGRIVLGGYWNYIHTAGVELAGFTSAGKPDSTFGHAGLVLAPGEAYGMTLQSDGKILIAGDLNFQNAGFYVERFNANGSINATFDGGHTYSPFAGASVVTASAVTVQSAGRILVVGNVDGSIGLARYNSAGTLDKSFGNGGELTVKYQSGLTSTGADLTVQSSGRIVIAGAAFPASRAYSDVGVIRYLGDHAVLTAGQSAVTTGTTKVADPGLAGTVIASRTVTINTGDGPNTTHGQVQEWVEKETGTGTLDFYYRIVNTSSPAGGIFNLIADNFINYTTYVDYRPDSAGTIAPVSAERSSGLGRSITFNFLPTPGGNGVVAPGQQSFALFIKTNATQYDLNGTMIVNNVINYDGYEPIG